MALFRKKKKQSNIPADLPQLSKPTEPLTFTVANNDNYAIECLGEKNAKFDLPLDELKKVYPVNKDLYQFYFIENKYPVRFVSDPYGAIMVIINDLHIGMVPQGYATNVFRQYVQFPCNVSYSINGGKSKYIGTQLVNDDLIFNINNDTRPYYVHIEITPI